MNPLDSHSEQRVSDDLENVLVSYTLSLSGILTGRESVAAAQRSQKTRQQALRAVLFCR